MNQLLNSHSSITHLIVGLGNPGRRYQNTRHNIGFLVVDRLAERLGLSFSRVQFRALVTDGRCAERRILLAKPQTYMNESGQAVSALVKFYKIPLAYLMVVHDDADLPFGTIRIRPGGSSAGQKGMASIIASLGTQEFPRLRMGVGRPSGSRVTAAYVLQEFSRTDAEILPIFLDRAVDAVFTYVSEGLEKAMNRFNGSLDV